MNFDHTRQHLLRNVAAREARLLRKQLLHAVAKVSNDGRKRILKQHCLLCNRLKPAGCCCVL
jgi:hypothetical protein